MKRTLIILGILFTIFLAWNFYTSQSEIRRQVEESPKTPIEDIITKPPYSANSIPKKLTKKSSEEAENNEDDFQAFYEMSPDFLTGVWRADTDDLEIILKVVVEDGFFSGDYCAKSFSKGVEDCKTKEDQNCGMTGAYNNVIIEIDFESCLSDYGGKGLIKRKGENMIWNSVSKRGKLEENHLYAEELTFLKLYDDPFQ